MFSFKQFIKEGSESGLVYVMRHGATALDELHRSDGWLDYPLSDAGRGGLIHAQQYLKDIQIKKIYCAPLRRTTETAKIISSGLISRPEIIKEDCLMTWHLGTLMGSKKKPNKPIVKYFMEHPDKAPEGGESLAGFQERFNSCMKMIEQGALEDDNKVLVVLSGSNLRELGRRMYNDTTKLDLDEGGLISMKPLAQGWQAEVIFGHKDENKDWNEWLS